MLVAGLLLLTAGIFSLIFFNLPKSLARFKEFLRIRLSRVVEKHPYLPGYKFGYEHFGFTFVLAVIAVNVIFLLMLSWGLQILISS